MDPNTPSSPQPSTPPVSVQSNSHKFNYLLLIIPLVIIFVIIVVIITVRVYAPNLLSNLMSGQEAVKLPVSLSAQNINDVSVLYELRGNVKEIREEGNSVQLVLDTQLEGIPTSFIYHPMARLFYSNDTRSSFRAATLEDIQVGQQVIVGTDYILKSQVWGKDKDTWRLLYVHMIKPQNFFTTSP